jgi:hypothetical protein
VDDFSNDPWLSKTSLDFAEGPKVKNCDAVLEIIDTIIRSNSCEDSGLNLNCAEMGLSAGFLTPPPLSTTSCDDPELSIANIVTPKTTRPQSGRASIIVTIDPKLSQDHVASSSIPDTADLAIDVSPAIGELGRRRGFKGAPLRIRGRSFSQKLTTSLLAPLSPMASASKEILSLVSSGGSPSNDTEKLSQADYISINPFATHSVEPYYVLDNLSADDNLYDFSMYSKRTQQHESAQSGKSQRFSQTTRIYDIAINEHSITSESLGTVHLDRKSALESGFINHDRTSNVLQRSSLRMDSLPKPQNCLERSCVSLDRATAGFHESRLSEVGLARYGLSDVNGCQVSRLRTLVKQQQPNSSARTRQSAMAVTFSRPQALSEIINLLDFDHVSGFSGLMAMKKYGKENDKENVGTLESHCDEVYAI